MSTSMNIKKYTVIITFAMALLLGISGITVDIEAYASGISKPAVTAENTSPTAVKLSWKKVKGAKKYIVYRSDKKTKGYKAIKTISKTSYSNAKLTCGKKYYYKVVAVNGNKKSSSKIVTVTTKPAKVTAVSSSGDCSSITLTWKKASSVSGYEVYCVTDNELLADLSSTSFTHEGLVLSETKQYKVRAYKKVGKKNVYGSYSDIAVCKTNDSHTESGSWTIVKKATCSAKGSKSNTCSVCGATIIQDIDIDPSKHSFVTTTTPASCTVDGATTTKCEFCSKVYSTTVIKAEHKPVTVENGIPASCTTDGKENDVVCSVCGELLKEGKAIPATGHTEISANNRIEPTCTTDGKESDIICEVCNSLLSDGAVINMFGHNYGEWSSYNSTQHIRYCEICNCEEVEECNYIRSIEIAPTYKDTGLSRYTCRICGASYTEVIPVNPCLHEKTRVINSVEVSCTAEGYTGDTYCDDCENVIVTGEFIDVLPHIEVSANNAIEPTCTEDGKESDIICRECNEILKYGEILSATGHIETNAGNDVAYTCTTDGKQSDIVCSKCNSLLKEGAVIPAHHDYIYSTDESGLRIVNCENCDYEKAEAVCVINLTDKSVSNAEIYPELAVFSVSDKGNDNLDINPDGVFDFEIIGTAENLTIDINADKDVDIKLSGVTIKNDGRDAIDIKKKGDISETDAEGNVTSRSPEVSISAKDGTENTIIVTTSGNAIENDCELSFKGHGVINIETVSTAINSSGKINIKNLTLNIKSGNRGIDTKTDTNVTNPITGAITVTTSYYNIKVGANANLTIDSVDDCIRCKNMEIPAIKIADNESESVIVLTSSSGDGIQIEGNTGFTANSGDITINAKKYAFNCKQKKISINGTAKVNAEGSGTYCKPEA